MRQTESRDVRAGIRVIFGVVVILLAYGSLYPFDFVASGPLWPAVQRVLQDWSTGESRGDILGNVALFVPFGFFGLMNMRRAPALTGAIAVLTLGTALALGLQLAQLFVVSRDAALHDVFWNVLGVLVGMAGVALPLVRRWSGGVGPDAPVILPLTLIGGWFAAELLPLVPALDLAALKESAKPLLLEHRFHVEPFLRAAVAWLGVACLLHASVGPATRALILGIVALMGGKLLVVDQAVTLSDVAGAGLAILLWIAGVRAVSGRNAAIGAAALGYLVYTGVTPLVLAETRTAFLRVPFQGYLEGEMLVNAAVLARKAFFMATALYLLREAGLRLRHATPLVTAVLLSVEIVQVYTLGHTPAITDPILVLVIGGALWALLGPPVAADGSGEQERRDPHTRGRPAHPWRRSPSG